MLGCKFIFIDEISTVFNGINRYMLGCKCQQIAGCYHLFLELIDTCWDVNVKRSASLCILLN